MSRTRPRSSIFFVDSILFNIDNYVQNSTYGSWFVFVQVEKFAQKGVLLQTDFDFFRAYFQKDLKFKSGLVFSEVDDAVLFKFAESLFDLLWGEFIGEVEAAVDPADLFVESFHGDDQSLGFVGDCVERYKDDFLLLGEIGHN